MIFLPIVARELRVASRRRATYWVRTGSALAVILLGTFVFLLLQREQSTPNEIAQVLFGILTASAILYSLFSGVSSTADCLSEEKREGTFGLLFLTDLKGYDVILGKLAASSLNGIYGIMAVVPMLAVPLLMGGVSPAEFGRMALIAVNSLFFSLALGMCVSAMSRSARKSMLLTIGVILVITAVFPGIGGWLKYTARAPHYEPYFFLPSPGFSYFLAWDATYAKLGGKGGQAFWISLGILHSLAWLCLILASIIAPRSWRDKPADVKTLRWRERWRLWSYGNFAERVAFRQRLLHINPFFWLSARARLKPASVWAVFALLACGWAWGLARLHREWLDISTYVMTGMVLNFLLKIWIASEAGRQLAEDRKQGALELLLSTPLSIAEILRGQRLALQRQFLGPLVLTLILAVIFMLAPLKDTSVDLDSRTAWVGFWMGGMVLLVGDIIAFYWVGMWQALRAKNPISAIVHNLLRIAVFPTIVYALVCLIRALSSHAEPTWKFFVGWWVGPGLAADLFFGLIARHKLLTHFRVAATQRYDHRARSSKQSKSEMPAVPPAPTLVAARE